MTTDLTDRYVWAVVRLLPEERRPDIDLELRSLIGDMTDGHIEAGETVDVAERAVLTELGDPNRMASRYVEEPRSLIGPELFPAYLRTLKVVAGIAIPVVIVLSVLGAFADGDGGPLAGRLVSAVVSGAYHAAVQVAVWVTVVYAISGWRRDRNEWTPDRLSEMAPPLSPHSSTASPATGPGVAELAVGIVLTILVGVALVWQHVWPPLEDSAGEGVPFLDPAMWGGAGQALLVSIVASVAVQALVVARRGWTMPLALANAAVNAVSIGIAAWASFGGWLINDRFLEVLAERAEWTTVPSVDPWLPVLVVAAVDGWDSIEAFVHVRRGRRARRAAPAAGSAA